MIPRTVILSGGGTRCAYSAGLLCGLVRRGIHFPHIIAASGSAGTAAYYAAGQYAEIERIWTHELATPMFISLYRPWKVMDVAYLTNTVFAKRVPLDTKRLRESPTLVEIASLNAASGIVSYTTLNAATNPFEVLRATKTGPLVCGARSVVYLNGVPHCDSPLSCRAMTHISHCVDDSSADSVLLVDVTHPGMQAKVGNGVFDLWLRLHFPQAHATYTQAWAREMPCDTRVYTHRPDKLRMNMYSHTKEALRYAFDLGVHAATTLDIQ